jgi:4-hydroxybenzoate polyprenyltransferase
VRDWLHFLPLPLAGWWTSGSGVPAFVASVIAWGFGLAYASAINQAFDDRLDRASLGKNPVGGRFDRRAALLWSVPPAVGTVVTTAVWSRPGLLPALIFLFAATVYSAPPRLKAVPVVGTLWNLVVGMPGLFFAGRPALASEQLRLLIGLFAVLLLVAQLIHEVVDVRDDRAGGVSTLGTLVGLRGALGAACGLLILLPGATWWLARDVQTRGALTAVVGSFAVAWTAMLAARILRNDAGGVRALRLRYRHATFVLGVTAFVLVNL